MIRVGILGFGFMGRTHYTRYSSIEDACVVAVADREVERQKADFMLDANLDLGLGTLDLSDVTFYTEAEQLIRDDRVDVVDVCLPTFLHKKFVDLALQHKKHVICEKPVALSSPEALDMVSRAKEAGCHLYVAQVIRFWPEYRYLYDLVLSKQYGNLQNLNLFRRTAEAAWTWDNWNLDVARSGGILDIRIHELDFVQFLLGMPDQLYAQALKSRNIINSIFSYKDGPTISIESNRILPPSVMFEDGFDAVFEYALLRYCGQREPKLKLYVRSSDEPIYPNVAGDGYLDELRYFVSKIENGDAPDWASAEGAARALQLWENEIQSVEKGDVIKIKKSITE
jgi:predicted dehydrogenase